MLGRSVSKTQPPDESSYPFPLLPAQAQQTTYSPPPTEQQTYPPPPTEEKHPYFAPPPIEQLSVSSPPPQLPISSPAQPTLQASASADDVGTFNGGSYRISHRSSNTILTLQLAINCPLVAKPGAMIGMSSTVTLSGSVKFSMKKYLAGASITTSNFTGPGEVILAPAMPGDVIVLVLDGTRTWRVGKHNWLAATSGVVKDVKAQALSKAFFSGEGLYTYTFSGQGLAWVASFGAIIRKDLEEGEQYLIDNHHLVAWSAKYQMERITSGGIVSELSAREGIVCRFNGPGTVYFQTRSPRNMALWMRELGQAT